MTKEITKTAAAQSANVEQPVELTAEHLNSVAGGYTREEWVMILKEMEKQKDGC